MKNSELRTLARWNPARIEDAEEKCFNTDSSLHFDDIDESQLRDVMVKRHDVIADARCKTQE